MAKWTFPEKSIKKMDEEIAQTVDKVTVSILPMKLSGDRIEYYVRISRGKTTYETNRYVEAYYNRALFERDSLKHVINGGPKPNLMDPQYADPEGPVTQRLS